MQLHPDRDVELELVLCRIHIRLVDLFRELSDGHCVYDKDMHAAVAMDSEDRSGGCLLYLCRKNLSVSRAPIGGSASWRQPQPLRRAGAGVGECLRWSRTAVCV